MNGKHKIFSWIFYLSIVAVHLLFALQKVYDTDVWLHMGLGKYMVEQKTLPSTDLFTFTGYGNPHEYVEWFFQVFSYLLYYLGGYNGLMVFKVMLWFVCMGMLWQWMKTEGVESRWAAFFTVFSAFLLAVRWRERPELVGFFSIIFYLLVLSLYRNQRRNWFYFLPGVQIIWVNSHPSALLGIVIYGIILLGEGIDYLWDKNKGDLRIIKALSIIIPVLIGVSLVNPYGYKSLILPYIYTANETVRNFVVEWQSLWYSKGAQNIYLSFAIPAALSFVPRFINPRKDLRISDLLLFLLGGLFPYWSTRYVGFFALIALPIAGKNIYWFFSSRSGIRGWRQKLQPRIIKVSWALPGIILFLGILLFELSPKRSLWGWGLQKYTVPEQALVFIEQNHLPGRIYNDYTWGGYIIFQAYPDYQPYIDSRAGLGDVTGQDAKIILEALAINEATTGWEKRLELRGVNLIMMRSMYSTKGTILPLVLELLKNPNWILIWNQDASLVFLRHSPENQWWTQKLALPKSKIYEEIIVEAQYLIDVHEVTSNSYYSMGWAYLNLGNYKEAKEAFTKQLRLHPLHQGARQKLEIMTKQGY